MITKREIQEVIKNRSVKFLITVLFLFLCWEILYDFWLGSSALNYFLSDSLGQTSRWVFSLLGFHAIWNINNDISLDGMEVIHIGLGCTGLEFFGLFACFIIAFPAKFKAKAITLPLGILLIHILNLLRVKLLVINYYFFNSSFDFNHKVTFTVVIYGVILVFWVLWAKYQMRYSNDNR